jgi:hypothetical protein
METNGEIRRRGGGERVVEDVSLLIEGDLKSQWERTALPSYSRMDFADILFYRGVNSGEFEDSKDQSSEYEERFSL